MISIRYVLGVLALMAQMLGVGWLQAAPGQGEMVALKGANGVVVEFLGLRQATKEGLHLMIDREQGEVFVLWTSFDLEDLEQRQPKVYRAYRELRSGGQPVDLSMGLYASLMTKAEMIKDLKAQFAEKMQLDVPPMTEFFDMSGFDNRYNRGDLNSVYSSWERRSETYLRQYERLLGQFFGLKTNEGNRSTWTYTVNGKVKYTVFTEVKPPQGSVSIKPLDFIHYLADPQGRESSMLVTYFRKYPTVHKQVVGIMDRQSKALGDGLVMGEPHEITVLKATVDDTRQHLHGMLQSTSLSADMQRDMGKYLRTWELSQR